MVGGQDENSKADSLLERILSNQTSAEGWFKEYEGADLSGTNHFVLIIR